MPHSLFFYFCLFLHCIATIHSSIQDVWTANRDLRVAWIRRKGNVLPCFLPGITTDETLALEVAKHTWKQFHKIGDAFLNDKQFVIKALKLDGRCIKHVKANLKTDYEVLTVAVANYYNRYDYEMAVADAAEAAARRKNKNTQDDDSSIKETTPLIIASLPMAFRGFCDINQLKEIIVQKLRLYDFYLLSFLRGIAISSPRGPPALRSTLTMLDRGVETSEAFKRLIAEYLSVPVGKELTLIRKALVNINRPAPNGDPKTKDDDNQLSHIRDVVHRRLQGRNNDDDNNNNGTNNREDVIGIFPLLVAANPPFVPGGRVRGIAPQAIRRRYVIRGVRGFEIAGEDRVAQPVQHRPLLQDMERLDAPHDGFWDDEALLAVDETVRVAMPRRAERLPPPPPRRLRRLHNHWLRPQP